MRIKTSDLIGAALDWAVSEIEHKGHFVPDWHEYSTDWAKGGPIIEREKMDVGWNFGGEDWESRNFHTDEMATSYGPTPLIAAMRCYVAANRGDEVEVPDEFC